MSDSELNTARQTDNRNEKKPDIPELSNAEQLFVVGGFSVIQKLLLILTGLLTLGAAGMEVLGIYENGIITLADILMMFLYTEVVAMVVVSYTGRGSPFIYPIFIAITAIARLIVLQGKDMDPQNILFEAGAIVLLALAAIVIMRLPRR
ncbi:phosphate-starvation-inducible protein PsiE [Marinobacter orientalis]|uniref:Protein PsiE n=1 Tax=Marinobacter orientalis TaxID=1928859 RepID=A0A7Y0RDS1_9GAMM|nr:phosphate-starvation-inducible PsiE family protein [Marinobacter orientalis]NMT64383.1 phosphate-starvation-inducible PsiE family protein [Marinobacter orientalis]TGX50648.1 phosphate-starvation-inducible E [Marinobacter orientalis]